MFYVYFLRCKDGSFYTGYTDNLERRLKLHNEGKASRYTRSRLPVKLIAQRSFTGKSEALRYEIKLKSLSRRSKMEEIGRDMSQVENSVSL